MNNKTSLLISLVVAGLVSGCADLYGTKIKHEPTRIELEKADYGTYPKDYKKQIKTYLDASLKDPTSLKIKHISEPAKSYKFRVEEKPHWYDTHSDKEYFPVYAWCVKATYLAKNGYGAYSDWKTKSFLFKDGPFTY